MSHKIRIIPLIFAAILTLSGGAYAQKPVTEQSGTDQQDHVYTYGPASRDGIGKFYLGREISKVMGHRGAGWLERSSRRREERTDLLLKRLPLKSGDFVADIGAGTGYFTIPIAKRVGPNGRVFAVDIQPEMLAIIEKRRTKAQLQNIELVQASETDPRLPADTIDLVLMVDAYHEFSHPREVMTGIVKGLKVGGAVVLIEYRAEDPTVPIKPLHKMSAEQAVTEMVSVGLELEDNLDVLPQQHFMIFRKKALASGENG